MKGEDARREMVRQMRVPITFDLAEAQLDELRAYAEHSERWVRLALRDFRARADIKMKLADPYSEGSQALIESLAEDSDQLESTFPNILRMSLLMQCCSAFEHSLVKVAQCFESPGVTSFLDVANDTGIKKARTYLKKTGGVAFPDQTEAWSDIVKVFDVRNVAVHANGTVLENPKHPKQAKHKAHFKALQARWPDDLQLDRFRQMTFSATFIPKVLDVFETFLRELRRQTRARLREK